MTTTNQCPAKSKSTGERCKNPTIRGAKTCRMHGSATRASREKARERLHAAADDIMAELIGIARDRRTPVDLRIKAMQDLLTRADISGTNKVEVTNNRTALDEETHARIAAERERMIAAAQANDRIGHLRPVTPASLPERPQPKAIEAGAVTLLADVADDGTVTYLFPDDA